MNRESQRDPLKTAGVVIGVLVVILILIFTVGANIFGYWFVNIDSNEIGVITKFGKYVEVVGPGQYTDIFNLGADITEVNTSAIPFGAQDPQVALKGLTQTVGIQVTGIVLRPGVTPRGTTDNPIPAMNEQLWGDYKSLYTNDQVLLDKMIDLTKQAMKVCIGDRTLIQAIVGDQRNDVSQCIDDRLTVLASPFALDIRSVVVPDVTLPPEVEASIVQISQAGQDAQLAVVKVTQVYAEGQQQQAQIINQIQATAAGVQAGIEAQSTQAAAKQQQIQAQINVNNAQATLDGSQLLYQKAQAQIKLEIAQLNAQSENAQITVLAQLYQANPEYAAVIIQTAFAEGLKSVSKVFYIPTDTKSLSIIGGVGAQTLVDQNGNMVPIVPNPEVVTPVPGS